MKHLARLLLLAAIILPCATNSFAQDTAPATQDATTTATPSAQAETKISPDVAKPSEDGKATVYVYRYKRITGSALEPSVFCDDIQLARMDNGRYFVMKLTPGKHTFYSTEKQAGIELSVEPNREYYIRVDITPALFKGKGSLMLMQNEQGAYEIKKLKLLSDGKIKDKTMVLAESAATITPSASAKDSSN